GLDHQFTGAKRFEGAVYEGKCQVLHDPSPEAQKAGANLRVQSGHHRAVGFGVMRQ
nr:hypothetical protein [Tanacetum cinerariifolium]